MLIIEADIYEYVRMSYVDKNILGPLVHMHACKPVSDYKIGSVLIISRPSS